MHRAGLVYYPAAVIAAGLFVAAAYYAHSVAQWGADERWARTFLVTLVVTTLGGLLPYLLAAFVLRRAARAGSWRRGWQWMAAGVAVGMAVLWTVVRCGYLVEQAYFPPEWQQAKSILMFPFLGPIMLSAKPLWLPVPAFAATAYVLFRIQRAFGPAG